MADTALPHRLQRAVIALAAFIVLGGVVTALAPTAHAARLTTTCGNTTADTARLQAEINSSAPGDQIVFQGTCLINQTLVLLGGRRYSGDSTATTLREAPGSNLAAVLASDSWANNTAGTGLPIQLTDLTVDANKAGNPTAGDGIVIRSWQTTLQNLTIENAHTNGLRITNQSKNGTALTSTQVNGTVRNLFITDSGGNGIYVQDSGNSVTDWNLEDNWVAGSGQNAILSENAAGWTIANNHVYGNGASGISAARLFASTISNNYIEDFKVAGMTMTVQGDAASVVSGNRVFEFAGSGTTYLAIAGVNYGTGLVSVTGNVIRGNGSGVGLSYQRGANQLTVVSTGNLVSGVTTARSVGAGVSVTAGQ